VLPDSVDRRRLKELPAPELVALIEPHWRGVFGCSARAEGTVFPVAAWQETFVIAAREEATSLADLVRLAEPLFVDAIVSYTPEAQQCLNDGFAGEVLSAFREGLTAVEPFDYDQVNHYLRDLRWRFKSDKGLTGRQVMSVIRAALTGALAGPCLVVMVILLGKARCLQRTSAALQQI